MKKSIVCTVLVFLLSISAAFAESPVGKWSGTGTIFGWLSGSCSATFSESGNVTMSSGGYSLNGKWSSGTIRVGAGDDTIKVKYRINDDGSMTMTSSYSGMSGKATLRRKGGAKSTAAASNPTVYGIWKSEDGAVARIYSAGYFHYTWSEANEAGEIVQRDFISTLEESEEDALVLTPFAQENGEAEEEIAPVTVTAKVSGDTLTLTYEGTDTVYTLEEKADAKPESDLFAPYVALERNDRGQAVKCLQDRLTQAGCLNDKIDGIFGSKTEAAVLLYEQQSALAEDGIADEAVRLKLLAEYPDMTATEED